MTFTISQPLPDFQLWEKKRKINGLFSFTLELTARCNNNCRHCYINLPEDDPQAKGEELSLDEIKTIVDQAVALGAVWCLITGGEPLLREDFTEIYLYLKRQGLLVTVFTNATLITQHHVDLFKKYPPRDIEVTVYGISAPTFAAVTRKPQLFEAFQKGLQLLLDNNIKVCLKNVTIKANLIEFQQIAEFCRKYSSDPFRFDPLLHLRFDRDESRNTEIRRQRLSPQEIADLERSDAARHNALQKNCDKLITAPPPQQQSQHIFYCGTGVSDFIVGYTGLYRLCSSLWHPELMADLRTTTIKEARQNLVPAVRALQSTDQQFLSKCAICPLVNLCLWCPAHAFLETGQLDASCQYFCDVAECRQKSIQAKI
jgi:radical SAM protein with 4Fe4S-binding SPASM domain